MEYLEEMQRKIRRQDFVSLIAANISHPSLNTDIYYVAEFIIHFGQFWVSTLCLQFPKENSQIVRAPQDTNYLT